MSRVPPRRTPPCAGALSITDLYLLAFGPWDESAQVPAGGGERGPLWDPRCDTDRLRDLWRKHEAEVRACAGNHEPWVESRLWFVARGRALGGVASSLRTPP